jgi:glucosyl-3-phosphoglycerate synthase
MTEVELTATRRIAVCIPARDEAPTVGGVVDAVVHLQASGFVSEIVVVDDQSTDATAAHARAAGARVIASPLGPGKGEALRCAVSAIDADVFVFLDADVTSYSPDFVGALVAPLADLGVQLVKPAYRRSLNGRADEGGRVTELLARPLLRRFFPALATVNQPLAGETAIRREALDDLTIANGYGIEIGMLIDVYRRYGRDAIGEVDLGERVHRNRPLRELRTHADDVLGAVLARVDLH